MAATLSDHLNAAANHFDAASVTAMNAAITMINATRTAIAAAIADAGDGAAVKAHIAGEVVTAIPLLPTPTVGQAATPLSGPAAVPPL